MRIQLETVLTQLSVETVINRRHDACESKVDRTRHKTPPAQTGRFRATKFPGRSTLAK
jgi:hypothetical protein